ncbi:MAG: DNA mismatch repair protein MutS [Tannerellaceae bacterium]|nr:DNA mismatch repair protein MutS [Tannerellaceae bacterium]
MEKVYAFYEGNIQTYSQTVTELKRKIHLVGTLRLLLVAGLAISIWLFSPSGWAAWTSVLGLFILPFILLMVIHTKLFEQRSYAETMIRICEEELKGLDYDFSAFDGAPDKINPAHAFSLDLDLFGNHSLFQAINRTVTAYGRELLAGWFTTPLSTKEAIEIRQQAVAELATLPGLRHHFRVTGSSHPGTVNDIQQLEKLAALPAIFSHWFWKMAIWLVPFLWILVVIGITNELLPPGTALLYFFISAGIANAKTKQINAMHNSVDKINKIFAGYARLMVIIEENDFQAASLREIKQELITNGQNASGAVKRLSSRLHKLDQRANMGAILLNIFYLRDTRTAMQLEEWNRLHSSHIHHWVMALGKFDALCSIGTFAFNHPAYIYPAIAGHYFKMEGKALGHPLLRRDQCVTNDIDITKSPWFLIVTGANMAGKSTYLRTIGVNFLLGCIGAPVFAESLTLYPAHLVTSLRTSDSLAGNESYFFAELKRLKMIIDRLQSGEEMFIILDEILKGTNSIDKQKGSIALMKQLVKFQASGIIATHDLALGKLEAEFPDAIKNYRFEADIQNNELSFSYKLREGVAQNMNASFLMKKMGITME